MSYTEIDKNNGCTVNKEVQLTSFCNSLIGYTLKDALKAASDRRYPIDCIFISSPPKMNITEYDDSFRVIRVKALKNKSLNILVCKPL
ncbi:hypothetical protein [Ruminiclostridium cellulolyticum]|uniref:Uncharacterized protein n=1 Tax=Ruminiclostridium cellulolyticum (strain ATCC 35319 / DSM 5812 / JCM 6584 / H10) TaxID=394503 RepID=B8I6D6_RUMCH|nr:hypothetical protein [Ruminiclostridium cellulolyticum]ACL74828.1 hypothetical protein Ccel_0446 [Ruminiclostridium cellulolyticum H10]